MKCSRCLRMPLLALVSLIPASACRAGVVVQVDANPATIASGLGGAFQQVVAVSWTTTQAFSDVTIQAAVATANVNDSATAYLTTKIGAGTTAADVVAQKTFVMPQLLPLNTAPDFTIFTGLNLAAGTYYLSITSPFDSSLARGWRGTSNAPTVSLAPGVTLNSALEAKSGFGDANFAPDSTFSAVTTSYQFAVVAVPEPSSIGLMAVGGLLAALGHFYRSRASA